MKSFRDALRHRRFRGLAGAGSEVGIIGTKKEASKRMPLFSGAGDRTRTGTRLPARDFKSLVSTIPPHRRGANTVSRGAGGVK